MAAADLSMLILRSRGERRASDGSEAGERRRLTADRVTPTLRLELWIETELISLAAQMLRGFEGKGFWWKSTWKAQNDCDGCTSITGLISETVCVSNKVL